jgi:uncharacterized membrane protein YbhN (UPF0104 family)
MEDQPATAIRSPAPTIGRGLRARGLMAMATVLVLALLAVALLHFPLAPLFNALRSADLRWLAVALLANLAIFPFWIWQWRILAVRFDVVPWSVMGRVVALSLGARVTVSGLGGVASGGAALHLEAGLTPQQAASVLSLDQILAGLTKVLLLSLVLVFVSLPDAVWSGVLGVMAVFAALVTVFAAVAGYARWLAPRIWLGSSVERRLFKYVAGFVQDLRKVAGLPVLVPAAVLAVLKKALEVLAAYAIQTALGIEGSWALALLVVASVSIVSLLPLAPVQLGPQALAVVSIYALFDTPTSLAVSAGVVHQGVALLTLGVVALAAFASGPVLSRFHGAS